MIAVERGPWIFSRRVDLLVFLGPTVIALALLALGWVGGRLAGELPESLWLACIVFCDVAHVWATAVRTYFDPAERAARGKLLVTAPAMALGFSLALSSLGSRVFWRFLAYSAIVHFIRQPYGWVALYRAKTGETGRLGFLMDALVIHAAPLYPLVFWHTHLPRNYSWFVGGDIFALPAACLPVAEALTFGSLCLYGVHSAWRWRKGHGNLGKDIVVATTALTWHLGLVTFNSDYAFTVTNVLPHGIPYFVLVLHYERHALRARQDVPSLAGALVRSGFLFFLCLGGLALTEECLWDRLVWHDRPWLFGDGGDWSPWERILVPVLALPQATHYVLDAFLWRRRSNPNLSQFLRAAPVGHFPRDEAGTLEREPPSPNSTRCANTFPEAPTAIRR
jgi:hypothetical protein